MIFGTQVSRKPSMSASAEAPLGFVRARVVVAVVAEVRRDERERRRLGGPLQVGREAGLAAAAPPPASRRSGSPARRRVRRSRSGCRSPSGSTRTGRGAWRSRRLRRASWVSSCAFERRVPAGGGLAVGVVAHVLHVGLPRPLGGRQLGADVLDRGRVHAADAALDAVRELDLRPRNSLKSWQSAWLSGFGGWPETSEM